MAEVLITLGIIGVVAAMTMPTLIAKHQDKARLTALKKAYSVLSQATNMVTSEHGLPEDWDIIDDDNESIEKVWKYYEPHLKVIKTCFLEDGCWALPSYKLNGSLLYGESTISADSKTNQYFFITADGMNMLVDISAQDWLLTRTGVKVKSEIGIFFRVDVNGFKGPNKVGYDIFHFVLTPQGLKPAGVDNDFLNCNLGGDGYSCAGKVLQEGKFDFK